MELIKNNNINEELNSFAIGCDDKGFSDLMEGGIINISDIETPVGASTPFTIIDKIPVYKHITTVNKTSLNNKKNKYIVIHYVGSVSKAKDNAMYFYSVNRNASANYFVDTKEIWQVVEDIDASWHCGGGLQSSKGGTYYKKCLNSNSIGIEMCMIYKNGKACFEQETIDNTIKLTKYLMNKHNIPIENVIRHYDVVGKNCPAPYVEDENAWHTFKSRLIETPHWGKEFLDYLRNNKYIVNPELWEDYDNYVIKSNCIALFDKITGGIWDSEDADKNIHWSQPHVISMCGKGYVASATIKESWLDFPDSYISKAQTLALIDKITGGCTYDDKDCHWGRNHLNSLCDKSIINTPKAWCDDFEAPVTKALLMSVITKTIKSGKIV